MKTKKKIIVTCSKSIFLYMLFGVALSLFLPIPFTVFGGSQHIALYIIFGLFALPFAYGTLLSKLFKVTVNGRKITVRKGIGGEYSFEVSEIVKVDWKIVINRMGKNEKITIRTASKHFSVESLMDGFDDMSAYISDNVDNNKINKCIKKLN